jgi:natural product precursor
MENKMKKLSLKKATLVELDNNQMKNAKGGGWFFKYRTRM